MRGDRDFVDESILTILTNWMNPKELMSSVCIVWRYSGG
jgi:hypothetical protein